jgi:thiol:disulfide interchange protein DsbD
MFRSLLFLTLTFLSVFHCQASSTGSGPHINVELISEHQSIAKGQTVWVGVLLSPEPEWHTYWRNPGDSGEAPTISWQADADIQFGDIQWPIPKAIRVAHLVNYGYEGENLLMVPITINQIKPNSDSVTLNADLSWLVCKEDCIPGWASLSLTLPISESPTLSKHAPLFKQTRLQLPVNTNAQINAKISAKKNLFVGLKLDNIDNIEYELTDNHIALSLPIPDASDWQLLPFRSDIIQHNEPQQWLTQEGESQANILLAKSDYFTVKDQPIEFLLTNNQTGIYIKATKNQGMVESTESFAMIVLFAFIGGLILNIMPCVLPVLSFKALSFAAHSHQHTRSNLLKQFGFPIGVLMSFWLFAALVISLKASGNAIGWGFHLQQPYVIAALAFLFVYIALMLWDATPSLFNLAGAGNSLTQGDSFISQFFTGVLAVIVASPCTAPFMASALGVAMISPSTDTLIIFTALGLGFALPMTLLTLVPQLGKLIPKPGNWMVTFKHLLAFPMIATVIWLVWVFIAQTSSLGQLWLMSGLVLFSFGVWCASQCQKFMRIVWLGLALATAIFTANMGAQSIATQSEIKNTGLSQPFSEQLLSELRSNNQVVFVNMTADWCITCKVNEQVAFSNESFNDLISDPNIHYLVGDWTNKNNEILQYLTRYQRSGVPLYVMYAGQGAGTILPQVLTPNIVINAINQAQQEINNEKR